jgi:phosphohistidine phosphatase SixA
VRLIIVRHAKAVPGSPDAERPLAPKGRRAAAALARELKAAQADAVISSPLIRAVQTAAPIAAAAGVEVEIDERLAPGATVEDMRAVVTGRGETVVTVGHQPDCSEIVFALTGRDVVFPTAGFHEVDL